MIGRHTPRESVRRKATGMTAEQIQEATKEAARWERQCSRVCDDEGDAAAIQAAIDEHKEWRRIGHLMAEQGLTTYNPDRDPIVQRRQRWEQRAHTAQAPAAPAPGLLTAGAGPAPSSRPAPGRAGACEGPGRRAVGASGGA